MKRPLVAISKEKRLPFAGYLELDFLKKIVSITFADPYLSTFMLFWSLQES